MGFRIKPIIFNRVDDIEQYAVYFYPYDPKFYDKVLRDCQPIVQVGTELISPTEEE